MTSATIRLICLTVALTCALLSENMPAAGKPEAVADGLQGGEGPVWSRDGYLLLSDTMARKIYKYVPGRVNPFIANSRMGPTATRWIGRDVSIRVSTSPGEQYGREEHQSL